MSDAIENLKNTLQARSLERIAENKSDQPKATTYQGDRKIEQLGQSTLDNNQLLSNSAVGIGDPVMPLATGGASRRVDSINGGANLGTGLLKALENNAFATGQSDFRINRTGGNNNNPSNPNYPNGIGGGSGNPDQLPPPNGCVLPSKNCLWSKSPTPPKGYQGYGDAVINQDGIPLYLYCKNFTPPSNLGCDFLKPKKWACSGGICFPSDAGRYNSQPECEAALVSAGFTGGQCVGRPYRVTVDPLTLSDGTVISGPSLPNGYQWTVNGAVNGVSIVSNTVTGGFNVAMRVSANGSYPDINIYFATTTSDPTYLKYLNSVPTVSVTALGFTDNCGDPPKRCGA